jgi:mycoredoxin
MAAFTMYSTPWCGYCHRLKGQLKRAGIEFTEVDIEQVPDAAKLVEKINGGNQTVPTVVFPDGTAPWPRSPKNSSPDLPLYDA